MGKKKTKQPSSYTSESYATSSSAYDDSQIKKDLEQTRNQSLTLKDQLDSIFDHYEKQSVKLMQVEKDLNDKEIELNRKESDLAKKEETLKQEEERIKKEFEEETKEIVKDLKEREERIFNLETKLSPSTTIETKLGKNQVVKLNVGGKIFATNLVTLKSVNDTFFTGYFNDLFNPTAEEDDNSFFIDRPNEQFHLILNYLRGIDISSKLSSLNEHDLNDFIEEIVYYQLTPIYEILPINGKKILKSKYSIDCGYKVEFDAKYCSSNIQMDSSTRVRGIHIYNGQPYAGVLGTSTNLFKVKLISNCTDLYIGFAPRTMQLDRLHYPSGYFLNTRKGVIFSNAGFGINYFGRKIEDGSIIECELKDGKISYKINGSQNGTAFTGVPNNPELYPAFSFNPNNGPVFEFIND
ncbi:predicted protein [Naegleria gruberi]|uniref:Predicted protein n=1 Tax=Naegleria gruberi TaxID=5762 RepID=D2VRK3_NAEGR|nr:uncharacterized protein NAEGRDRAFT_51699 [Naegleria gruberi]EFC40477.1 predicted protein [Naegleria gruberi]|eukprot:XP_002673221.1 predicted protein [Naegleria gruberi strain NEG-M]